MPKVYENTIRIYYMNKAIDTELENKLTDCLEKLGYEFIGSGYELLNDIRDLQYEMKRRIV